MLSIPFDPIVEEAIERLAAEFTSTVPPSAVRALVAQGRQELAGAPAGALPELVERLGRARILEALETAVSRGATTGQESRPGTDRRPSRRPRSAPRMTA